MVGLRGDGRGRGNERGRRDHEEDTLHALLRRSRRRRPAHRSKPSAIADALAATEHDRVEPELREDAEYRLEATLVGAAPGRAPRVR